MQVELTRFRVEKGKEELVDQWMEFLNEHMNDALLTLDGEKMFVETIMRDTMGDHDYLYWYLFRQMTVTPTRKLRNVSIQNISITSVNVSTERTVQKTLKQKLL